MLLGNCTRSYQFLKFVNEVSSNVVIVRGEFDNATIRTVQNVKEEIPMNTIIKQGDFKIGCCNGYTLVPKSDPLSLLILARQLDVDIMLWGGTHSVEAYTLEGKFFINPGSCTGAFSTDWPLQDDALQGEGSPSAKLNGAATAPQPTEGEAGDENGLQQELSTSSRTPREAEARVLGSPNNRRELEGGAADVEAEENSEDDEEVDEVDINGGCIPSFCLLDISGSTCTLYIYTFVSGEVKVDKVVYKKD